MSVSWMSPFSEIIFRDYDAASCPSWAAIGKVAGAQRCRPLGFETLPSAPKQVNYRRDVLHKGTTIIVKEAPYQWTVVWAGVRPG